jgi:hypothetical protein
VGLQVVQAVVDIQFGGDLARLCVNRHAHLAVPAHAFNADAIRVECDAHAVFLQLISNAGSVNRHQ